MTLLEFQKLKSRKPFTFFCKNCNNEVVAKKRTDKKGQEIQSLFLCRKCLQRKTSLEKYGVENISQLEKTKTKRKETMIERYGVEYASQSDEIKTQMKKTCVERFGVENVAQSQEIKEKIKSTNLERYGVEYTFQTENVKEKSKQTCIEKYGCENVSQSDEIKSKKKETMIEKYGVSNPMFSEEFKSKMKETMECKSEEEKREIRRKSNHKYIATDGEKFDSKWELKYYEYCLRNNFEIIREPIALEYEYDNKKHIYYPDFKVNGKLIEIKGNHFVKNNKWICPFKHKEMSQEYLNGLYEAKHKCALNNNVTILYQKDLLELGIL